jgi:hypothetical protein
MSKSLKALKRWDIFQKDVHRSTPVDRNEHSPDKVKRIKNLENHWHEWLKYYFPHYCKKPFTRWQKRYAKGILKPGKRFITRRVFRGGSKTTFTQMFLVYLAMTKRIRNVLYVSKNETSAIEMIRVIKIQFEANQRLIFDYGDLKNLGVWGEDKFVTRNGVSFRAIGKGQSPRGAKEEEARPDCIIWDDGDDDEEVRNKTRLDNTFDWVMGALFGCFSVDGNNLFIGLGNKIAPDCVIMRLCEKADDHETIKLLDDNGKPTCPEWFTQKDCHYMREKMGTRMFEQEYQDNPIIEGKVFKAEWLQDKPMLSLQGYAVLISYLDPSFKSRKNADHKALVLLGLKGGEIHIIKVWCDRASIQSMIEWHYELRDYLKQRNVTADMYMEEVFLQDLLYKDFSEEGKRRNDPIPIRGDLRKKPDKDARISAMGEYFERGLWYFNELEKKNHHMQRLKEQFKLFEMGNNGVKKDGPDACEGGLFLAQQKIIHSVAPVIGHRKTNRLY